RHQEMLPDALPGAPPHAVAQDAILEERHDMRGCLLDTVHEKTGAPVHDLMANAADVAPDHRPSLPHGLGDRKPETFAQGFLQHYAGPPLQRIHQEGIVSFNNDDPLPSTTLQSVMHGWPFWIV